MLDWIKVAGKLAYDRPTRERLLGYRPVVICLIQSLDRDAFLFVQPAARRLIGRPEVGYCDSSNCYPRMNTDFSITNLCESV